MCDACIYWTFNCNRANKEMVYDSLSISLRDSLSLPIADAEDRMKRIAISWKFQIWIFYILIFEVTLILMEPAAFLLFNFSCIRKKFNDQIELTIIFISAVRVHHRHDYQQANVYGMVQFNCHINLQYIVDAVIVAAVAMLLLLQLPKQNQWIASLSTAS